ncbi:MAG: leishmanolysin-related zinc metalloendopeptidase [Pseudomonadota bacterium]
MRREDFRGPERAFDNLPWERFGGPEDQEIPAFGRREDEDHSSRKNGPPESDPLGDGTEDETTSAAKGGVKGPPSKDDGTTDDGSTDDGSTKPGNGYGRNKDDGTTDDGTTDDGTTDDGTTDDGTTDDGTTDDGTTDDGTTDDGTTDDGTVTNTAGTDGLYTTYVSGLGDLGVVSDYNIELNFSGSWTVSQQTAVIESAEYLSTLVTGDLPDVGDVDDLSIDVSISSYDGSGGTIGWASLTAVRGDYLPYEGSFFFDADDVDRYESDGRFDDVALHEMGHLMGFGSIWGYQGQTADYDGDLRFTGENATLAYNAEFASIADSDPLSAYGVPIETDGGSGTAGKHWDDATFGSELFTGYINGDNYVSAMSVASLEDLGYDTIFDPNNPDAAIPQIDEMVFA